MPTPTPPGKIILINGPSSAGKTTLALELQRQLTQPFIRFSFDTLRDHKAFPSEQIANGVFAWKDLRPPCFAACTIAFQRLPSRGTM